MKEDRVDWHCNRIHVACIGLQRLKKLESYRHDPIFVELLANFCCSGETLMALIREKETGPVKI
jgi:hypothetical protein